MDAKLLEATKISNGISIARIISMFWIFSTNYFPWVFPAFYGVEYQYAIEKTENFLDIMNNNQWFVDKVLFVFSRADWPGVTIFAFLTGFSLWYSILNARVFKLGEYAIKRFNSVYVPYLISAVIAFVIGVLFRNIEVTTFDLTALVMGAAAFVPSAFAYNPSMWFISLVFLCYLFFPIIPVIYSKFRFPGILVFTLACYGLFVYYGALYFMYEKGPMYPLMPFWVFLCFGVLACHLILMYHESKLKMRFPDLRIMDIICVLAIIFGVYFLYRYLYLEPASDLGNPWFINSSFSAAMAGALVFFFIGYLLPLKSHRVIRWLSRGTLSVFLYHYIVLPFLAPVIGPSLFSAHLSIALVVTFVFLLVGLSAFQYMLDKTVIRYTRRLSYGACLITSGAGLPILSSDNRSKKG